MKFSDIWLFIAELKHPFNEKNLKFKWNPDTEPQEPRYFYCNAEDYPDDVGGTSSYKVKRYDCFTLLKDQNTKFKVQSK